MPACFKHCKSEDLEVFSEWQKLGIECYWTARYFPKVSSRITIIIQAVLP